MRTHIVVICPRCGHEWAYMGRKIDAVMRGETHRARCGAGRMLGCGEDITILNE